MKRNENGARAESIAFEYELHRLGKNSLRFPTYVGNQKGLGYDIESYDDAEGPMPRFIEVKSVSSGNSIFLTPNELKSLSALGSSAWLYVVDVEKRTVVKKIQNPILTLKNTIYPVLLQAKI